MPTPTGTIKFSDVNIELARGSTTSLNIGLAAARTLAGVPAGAISMSQLRGKSNATATGTMVAGGTAPSNVGYYLGNTYYGSTTQGSLTNSKSVNPVYVFVWTGSISNTVEVYTANGQPWATNPTSIVMTMNGVTTTMTWSTGQTTNRYVVGGNPFNIASGGSYSWSYK